MQDYPDFAPAGSHWVNLWVKELHLKRTETVSRLQLVDETPLAFIRNLLALHSSNNNAPKV